MTGRYLNLSPLDIFHEKRFAARAKDIALATGIHMHDLWALRAWALRKARSVGGWFVWAIWHPQISRRYLTQADDDLARRDMREHMG